MSAIDEQSVLITGAAQGLGAAIARHFHGLGAGLILLDRDADGLAEIKAVCPGATTAVVDLADAEATERAIAEVVTGPVAPSSTTQLSSEWSRWTRSASAPSKRLSMWGSKRPSN